MNVPLPVPGENPDVFLSGKQYMFENTENSQIHTELYSDLPAQCRILTQREIKPCAMDMECQGAHAAAPGQVSWHTQVEQPGVSPTWTERVELEKKGHV